VIRTIKSFGKQLCKECEKITWTKESQSVTHYEKGKIIDAPNHNSSLIKTVWRGPGRNQIMEAYSCIQNNSCSCVSIQVGDKCIVVGLTANGPKNVWVQTFFYDVEVSTYASAHMFMRRDPTPGQVIEHVLKVSDLLNLNSAFH
jgi:ABC-type proline/glycine betaine transport system ATPase subunit